jgi:hypothetical protein
MAESDLVDLLRRLFTDDSAYVFRFLQGKYSVELFHEGGEAAENIGGPRRTPAKTKKFRTISHNRRLEFPRLH